MTDIIKYAFPNQEAVRLAYDISDDRIENGRRTFDVCYDLNKVFDKSSYKNSKKYNNHITRYLNYAKNNELFVKDVETDEEKEAAKKLYKEWWNVKMEADRINPNHFKEHSERYEYCLNYAINENTAKKYNLHTIGLFDKDKNLLAFQTLAFVDDWAFDLSNANSRTNYSYIAEVSLVNFLKYLKEEKQRAFYNFGETGGDEGLLKYKEKLPNFRIYYGKLNIQFEKSSKKDIDTIKDFMATYSTEDNPFPTIYMDESITNGNVLKAVVNSKIVGIVECRNKDNKNLMTNLIVDKEYRCQGIAKALLDQLPKPFYFFCYITNNTGIKFYENLKNVKKLGYYKFKDPSTAKAWEYEYK